MPHHRALWTHFTPRRSHVAPPPPARDSRFPGHLSGLLKIAASAGLARDGGCGDHHCVSISTGPRCGQGKSSPLPSRPLLLGPKRVVLIPIVALAKKGLIPSDKRPGKGYCHLSLTLSFSLDPVIISTPPSFSSSPTLSSGVVSPFCASRSIGRCHGRICTTDRFSEPITE